MAESAPPNRLDILRTLRIGNVDVALATAFVTLTTGAFLVGFIQSMGGSDLWIGLLSAIPSLVGILQIPGAIWGRGFSTYKSFIIPMGWIWRACYAPLIVLPLLPWPGELRLTILAVCIGVGSAAIVMANPIYSEYIAEMVPSNSRGAYFSRRNAIATAVAAAVGILGAGTLDLFRRQGYASVGLATVFGMGILFSLASMAFFLKMHDLPRANPIKVNVRASMRQIRTPFQDPAFRRVLIFMAMFTTGQMFAGNLFAAFAIESLKLAFTWVQVFAVTYAIGNILIAPFWGFLADKYGSKPVLALAGFGMAFNPVPWLLCVPGRDTANIVILTSLHVIMGMVFAGVALCQFNIILATAKETDRANYIAAGLATQAIAGGAAPLLGASLMAALRGHLPLDVAYKVVFGCTMALRFVALLFLIPVKEHGATRFRTTLQHLSRLRPRGVRALRSLSETSDVGAREHAMRQVSEENLALASGSLIAALHDPSPRVRRQAAASLARLHEPEAAAALVHQVDEHPDLVEEETIEALGEIGGEEAARALVQTLQSPRSILRRAAAKAIGRMASRGGVGPVTRQAIIEAASDPHDPDLRRAALQAIRLTETSEGVEAIRAGLRDPLPSIRVAAAEAVAELRLGELAPDLRASLADYHDEACAEVGYALGTVGNRLDLPAILEEAERSDSVITRRRCLLGVARLLGVEPEVYRLFLRQGFERDQALLEKLETVSRGHPRVRQALELYSGGDEPLALRILAEEFGGDFVTLANQSAEETFLVAACAAHTQA